MGGRPAKRANDDVTTLCMAAVSEARRGRAGLDEAVVHTGLMSDTSNQVAAICRPPGLGSRRTRRRRALRTRSLTRTAAIASQRAPSSLVQPNVLDEKVDDEHLQAVGAELTNPSEEPADCIGVQVEGEASSQAASTPPAQAERGGNILDLVFDVVVMLADESMSIQVSDVVDVAAEQELGEEEVFEALAEWEAMGVMKQLVELRLDRGYVEEMRGCMVDDR